MDRQTLLNALSGTLDPNQQTRKHCEEQLKTYEQQQGFTSYLLDLLVESDATASVGVKVAAAIFFKNRVVNYWVVPENKQQTAFYLLQGEKSAIKEKLITTLFETYKDHQIRLQLSTALNTILSHDKWDGLIEIINKLLGDETNIDHVYTGLLCLYQYTKNYRWDGFELETFVNPVLEEVTQKLFPQLENLANKLIASDGTTADEMLYLIIKIFKFTTYSSLPSYLHDPNHLGQWCQIHILIIDKPLPKELLDEDHVETRNNNPRIKTIKWCFANMNRLLNRHGGGYLTRSKQNNQFAQVFITNFVPEILNAYWKIIERWSTKTVWLSEISLYHMISFLEQVIETPAWSLIHEKLDAIARHVVLPTLVATPETVELYEDDADEYIRRFFDVNREQSTSDVATINFIYRLSNKKFKETIGLLCQLVNEIFTDRINNRGSVESAMKAEGGLRILSTISYKLDSKFSPVAGQVDSLLHTFVYPELLQEQSSKTPWLTARACDTIAMFHNHQYTDTQVLQDIFQGVVACFSNDGQFPIQLTAADALSTLVNEDLVAQHVADQAPQLMGILLEKSKQYESDILTNVMDTFVEKFASNLEPYAVELGKKLSEQFIKIASEILESNGGADEDKEIQACGILNTLTTLVISMSNAPNVALQLESVLKDLIKFIFENAMVVFLTEVIEILESLLFVRSEVSPTIWEIFQVAIESFETYAYEYFDSFQPFFETIINKGFSKPDVTMDNPNVQSLVQVCFNVLKDEETDPVFVHVAFEDIELTILALNQRFVSFLPQFLPEIFDIFTRLESQDAFDGHMLHHLSILKILFGCLYIDPVTTIQFITSKGFLIDFYKLWIKHSSDFQSVYGCKLQILASMSIISNDNAVGLIPEDLAGETVDLLLANIATLPNAIKAKNAIMINETSQKMQQKDTTDANGNDNEDEFADLDDEYDIDEAELEAMKETPIDKINAFEFFVQNFLAIQQQQNKNEVLFGGLDASKKEMIEELVKVTQSTR
ncbi:Importin beta SMX1 [Candida viswanathii]|uniref:Importin beta SMX1 n=1 Tax=Candida viswanathii TaxID=5486 RepID=A0A367YPL6_9ASCO|nr:Importin beta SMX1 [Candida viswanathii]